MPRGHNTCNVFNFPKFNDFRPFVLVGRTTSINPIYFLPTDKLYEELIRRSITQLAIVAVPRWPDPNQRSTLNLYDSLLILNIYFNFWYFDAGIVGTGASSISSTTSPKFKYYTIYWIPLLYVIKNHRGPSSLSSFFPSWIFNIVPHHLARVRPDLYGW